MRTKLGCAALILLISCGGGQPEIAPPENVTLTISPATASIAVNTTLLLTANATGFTATPAAGWHMQEGPGSPTALDCGIGPSTPAPLEQECPGGYLVFVASGVPSQATYHAPATAGVYHATFQASQSGWKNGIIQALVDKSVTAEITVTD